MKQDKLLENLYFFCWLATYGLNNGKMVESKGNLTILLSKHFTRTSTNANRHANLVIFKKHQATSMTIWSSPNLMKEA